MSRDKESYLPAYLPSRVGDLSSSDTATVCITGVMFLTQLVHHLTLLSTVISFNYGTFLVTNEIAHDCFIISLNGKSVDQFQPVQENLQDLIAKLASAFCFSIGLNYSGIISSSTVVVHSVRACPSDWPNSSLCTSVNFSVPIQATSGANELTYKHLRTMWATHTDSQLAEIGLKEYEIPKNPTILFMWLGVTGLLIILFIIIVVVVLKTKVIEKYIRRRRDILGSSNRSWLAKNGNNKQLVPPYLQEEPSHGIKEEDIGYGLAVKEPSYGVENPGYNPGPGLSMKYSVDKEISQGTMGVDDFDSDDETIYPPAPPLRARDKNAIQQSLGVENPGYNRDRASGYVLEKKISQASSAVDDFDSDDDVIYPPAPPLRPQHQRNTTASSSIKESETAF